LAMAAPMPCEAPVIRMTGDFMAVSEPCRAVSAA
jgi:hypothetical protein